MFFQIEEDEKLKKRKERFGILMSAGSTGLDDVEVTFYVVNSSGWIHFIMLLYLHLCFLFVFLQAKKMKRAERFGKV